MTTKIPFRTTYSGQIRKHAPTGNGKYFEYKETILSSGEIIIEKTIEKNRYEEIQSFKDDCLIENIISRAQMGDTSMLRKEIQYGDLSMMPKSIIEAYMMTEDLKQDFNNLPLEERAKYDHNFARFLAEAGTLKAKDQTQPLEGEKESQANEKTEPPKEEQTKGGEN